MKIKNKYRNLTLLLTSIGFVSCSDLLTDNNCQLGVDSTTFCSEKNCEFRNEIIDRFNAQIDNESNQMNSRLNEARNEINFTSSLIDQLSDELENYKKELESARKEKKHKSLREEALKHTENIREVLISNKLKDTKNVEESIIKYIEENKLNSRLDISYINSIISYISSYNKDVYFNHDILKYLKEIDYLIKDKDVKQGLFTIILQKIIKSLSPNDLVVFFNKINFIFESLDESVLLGFWFKNPQKFFEYVQEKREFVFEQSAFKGGPLGDFSFLEHTKIQKIGFPDCNIAKIGDGLAKLIYLQDVNLRNNKLLEIEGFESLSKLSSLDLSINMIEKIKGLGGNQDLVFLRLSYNPIDNIESLPTSEIKNYIRATELSKKGLSVNLQIEMMNCNHPLKAEKLSDLIEVGNSVALIMKTEEFYENYTVDSFFKKNDGLKFSLTLSQDDHIAFFVIENIYSIEKEEKMSTDYNCFDNEETKCLEDMRPTKLKKHLEEKGVNIKETKSGMTLTFGKNNTMGLHRDHTGKGNRRFSQNGIEKCLEIEKEKKQKK